VTEAHGSQQEPRNLTENERARLQFRRTARDLTRYIEQRVGFDIDGQVTTFYTTVKKRPGEREFYDPGFEQLKRSCKIWGPDSHRTREGQEVDFFMFTSDTGRTFELRDRDFAWKILNIGAAEYVLQPRWKKKNKFLRRLLAAAGVVMAAKGVHDVATSVGLIGSGKK